MLLEFKELRKQWRKARKGTDYSLSESIRGGNSNLLSDGHRYDSNDPSDSLYTRPPHNSGADAASSIPILNTNFGERYPLSEESVRCTVDEHDNRFSLPDTPPRQRFGGVPSSWHGGSSRSSLHQHLSSSLPSQPIPHPSNTNLPHLDTIIPAYPSLSHHPSHPQPPLAVLNRLPPDSTLFTPLPGYQPSALLQPLQMGDRMDYRTGMYNVYEDDSNGRTSSGHDSLDRQSRDEH